MEPHGSLAMVVAPTAEIHGSFSPTLGGVMRADPPLRLSEHFTHLVAIEEQLVLVGEEDSRILEGPVVGDVIRLIDGRRGATDLAAALWERHPPEIVHFVLLSLEHGGLLYARREGTSSRGGDPEPPCSDARETADPLAVRLREAWEDREAREGAHLGLEALSVPLLLTDDYLRPGLLSLVPEVPHLLCGLGRRRVLLGPIIGGASDTCLACLQERLRLNLGGRTLVQAARSPDVPVSIVARFNFDVPSVAFETLAGLIREVMDQSSLQAAVRHVLAKTVEDGSSTRHRVDRLPHCESCGDPSLAPPGADIELRSREKVAVSGGGFRTVAPEETLRRYEPLVDNLTGVVRYVNRVQVEETDLVHVYTASHARHYGTATLRSIRGDRRDPSGGKGRTDLDARVSAVCESLERFSSVHRGTEPCRLAPHSELGPTALAPNDLLHFSDRQYRHRESSNAADSSGFQWVPEPYQDEPIEWSPARTLVSGDLRLVPSASLYFGFEGKGTRFCKGDSNGLAGGNCLEEAILQGLLELVERDAVALWWYNRARVPELDIDTSEDPYVTAVMALHPTLGRRLWVLDLTTDIGIPCFGAISALRSDAAQDIIFGFGAHLDPDIALSRALTEVNQMLPTVFRAPAERRRQLLPEFRDAIEWWESATLEEHPYLSPSTALPASRLGDYRKPSTTDLRDDVVECVGRVHAVGCDVLVHELTRPDVGFVVARTWALGLRHFWRRLGPGRLYDVPPALGWIEGRRSEEEMNAISMFV